MAPKVSGKAVKKAGRPAAKVNEDGTKRKTKRGRKNHSLLNSFLVTVVTDCVSGS